MTVASLPLCKELYELSGWDGNTDTWWHTWSSGKDELVKPVTPHPDDSPAYDLGYLLRKLPGHVAITNTTWDDIHTEKPVGQELDYQAVACYQSNIKGMLIQQTADTPEDATCKLAIELFKQGVLTKAVV